MKLKKFVDYFESKKYLSSRTLRIKDLIDSDEPIYSLQEIKGWMKKYNFDFLSKCIFVSDNNLDIKLNDIIDLRISSKDIKNKNFFDDNSKYINGFNIPESEIYLNEKTKIYLFVFYRKIAKQNHGFIYEGEVIKNNGLTKTKNTLKWDAVGTLNKSYLEKRLNEGKNISYYNGSDYRNITENSINNNYDIMKKRKWSIKSIKIGNEIGLADFKRISGLEFVDNKIKIHKNESKEFILCISFHDGEKIIEEYIVLIELKNWKKYLPDLENPIVLTEIENMYNELNLYKLNKNRTIKSEKKWKFFIQKYSKITFDNIIKLRFKRDSKGQLRIQGGINVNKFYNIILKENRHIKIS